MSGVWYETIMYNMILQYCFDTYLKYDTKLYNMILYDIFWYHMILHHTIL